ncbi:hypothetical protein [Glutamicibacter sp. NPDC087344]|uniref:hypothetical protein n=1 Tax=Glutamicibacter sp. NPDC087344 TaxID=3363994 RepID=UPI00382B8E62
MTNTSNAPSHDALELGAKSFIGLIVTGDYREWLVSVDVLTDTHCYGKRRKVSTSFEINLAPTNNAIPASKMELEDVFAVLGSLEEVINHLSRFKIRWLDESEAIFALSRLDRKPE